MKPQGKTPEKLRIYLLSGGTGRTAESVLNAALAQFDQPAVEIIRKANIRRARDAERIVRQAAEQGGVVCHTLVAPKIRKAVDEQLHRLNVPCVDPLGPVISMLADHLGTAPRGRAGLLYELCREQFDRSDAVDFTLAHDDGQRMHELDQADVVLIGVSRVSKSVTSFYVATRGIRAANVPLTPVQPVPPPLTKLDPRRVIGLTMNPARLCAVRESRLDRITHRHVDAYAEQRDVVQELRQAAEVMRRHHWRCIDISYKATEEVATEVIEMLAEVT